MQGDQLDISLKFIVDDSGALKILQNVDKLTQAQIKASATVQAAQVKADGAVEAARVQSSQKETARIAKEQATREKSVKAQVQTVEQSEKQIADIRLKYAKDSGEKIIADIHKSQQQQLAQRLQFEQDAGKRELAIMKSVALEKEKVQHGGIGAIAGILGTGRTVAGVDVGGLLGGTTTATMAGIGLAGAAAAAIGVGIYKAIDATKEYEKEMARFSALTGASGKDAEEFGQKALVLSKRWGVDAKDGLEAFLFIESNFGTKVLQDKEAMDSMANSIMTLSRASGLDGATSAKALADSVNQLGHSLETPAQQAEAMTKIMNVMAAGAREGAAFIPDLSQSLHEVGAVAAKSKIPVELLVGSLETLSKAGLKGAESGTMLRNIIERMSAPAKGADKVLGELGLTFYDINPERNGFVKSLQVLHDKLDKFPDPVKRAHVMMKLFGLENINAAQTMLDSIPTINRMTAAVTGTNVAAEEAATQMHTLGGVGDRLGAIWNADLIPALTVGADALVTVGEKMLGVPESLDPMERALEQDGKYWDNLGKNVDKAKSKLQDFDLEQRVQKVRRDMMPMNGDPSAKHYTEAEIRNAMNEERGRVMAERAIENANKNFNEVQEAIAAGNKEVVGAYTPDKTLIKGQHDSTLKEVARFIGEQHALEQEGRARAIAEEQEKFKNEHDKLEEYKKKKGSNIQKANEEEAQLAVTLDERLAVINKEWDEKDLKRKEEHEKKLSEWDSWATDEGVKFHDERLKDDDKFYAILANTEKMIRDAKVEAIDDPIEHAKAKRDAEFQDTTANYKLLFEVAVNDKMQRLALIDQYHAAVDVLNAKYGKEIRSIGVKEETALDKTNKAITGGFSKSMSLINKQLFTPLEEKFNAANNIAGAFFSGLIEKGVEVAQDEALKLLFGKKAKEEKHEDEKSPLDIAPANLETLGTAHIDPLKASIDKLNDTIVAGGGVRDMGVSIDGDGPLPMRSLSGGGSGNTGSNGMLLRLHPYEDYNVIPAGGMISESTNTKDVMVKGTADPFMDWIKETASIPVNSFVESAHNLKEFGKFLSGDMSGLVERIKNGDVSGSDAMLSYAKKNSVREAVAHVGTEAGVTAGVGSMMSHGVGHIAGETIGGAMLISGATNVGTEYSMAEAAGYLKGMIDQYRQYQASAQPDITVTASRDRGSKVPIPDVVFPEEDNKDVPATLTITKINLDAVIKPDDAAKSVAPIGVALEKVGQHTADKVVDPIAANTAKASEDIQKIGGGLLNIGNAVKKGGKNEASSILSSFMMMLPPPFDVIGGLLGGFGQMLGFAEGTPEGGLVANGATHIVVGEKHPERFFVEPYRNSNPPKNPIMNGSTAMMSHSGGMSEAQFNKLYEATLNPKIAYMYDGSKARNWNAGARSNSKINTL